MKVKEWDDNELGKLVRLYIDENVDMEELCKQLPGRTNNSIRLKASRLGLRRKMLEIPSISELNWVVHQKGERLLIVAKGLQLTEAIGLVMQNEDLEATGWEDTMPQVTIKRVSPSAESIPRK